MKTKEEYILTNKKNAQVYVKSYSYLHNYISYTPHIKYMRSVWSMKEADGLKEDES